MNRSVWMTRLYSLLLLAGYLSWMFFTGAFFSQPVSRFVQQGDGTAFDARVALSAGLSVLLNLLLMSALCQLAAKSKWPLLPVVSVASLVGILALGLGIIGFPLLEQNADLAVWRWLQFASGFALATLLLLQPRMPAAKDRFFLLDRTHSANSDARRALSAGFGQMLLLVLAVGWIRASGSGEGPPSRSMLLFLAAYPVGILLSVWQPFPIRQCGLVVIGALLATIFLTIHWAGPGLLWPVCLLGGTLGLMHVPARNYLLVSVPPAQRLAALGLFVGVQIIGSALALALLRYTPPVVWLLVALAITVLGIRLLFRELFEQTLEVLLWPIYRIRAFGPGATIPPMRGPVIVLANHTAWFDPLWLSKVVPFRVRPMMTARFYDLPGVRWLMKNVVRTIRVPEPRFRREMPEVQEAIAGLARGDTIMIFPEGWLRRKEDHSLRRFGQGVHQMLKAHPQTPVVVCWIEGGWKSFASYWNGLPTKNKRMDFWRTIRVGVSAPEVLKPELLADQKATRRYLMQACLQARAFLGLPPLPPPSFVTNGADEEKDEDA